MFRADQGDAGSEAMDPARAWAPYEPDAKRPWDLRLAGHLYRRAAFGATWPQLKQAVADGPQRTIAGLLSPGGDVSAFQRTYDELETSAMDPDASSAEALCEWWLRRLIQTPHPLLEKMTLFWHNHFASSNVAVQNPRLVQRYLQLLRTHALGRFSALLEGIVRDPAALMSLALEANTKFRPDDNFARALLECFTLGPGHFSEQDVQGTARALTGWSVVRRQLRYVAADHDGGVKRILGQEGNFGGDDLVRILLKQPATPRLLVRKLYRWLISETTEPSDALLAPLVESYARDYDAAKLVETMLRSNVFFSPTAYRRRIKSPVEFVLGIVRPLEAMIPTSPLVRDLAALGQDLCHPPTVHGWEGGRVWITTTTLVRRSNLAAALLTGSGVYGGKLDPPGLAKRHGFSSPKSAAQFLLDLFLQGDVEDAVRQAVVKAAEDAQKPGDAAVRQLTHALVTLPEFQLA